MIFIGRLSAGVGVRDLQEMAARAKARGQELVIEVDADTQQALIYNASAARERLTVELNE